MTMRLYAGQAVEAKDVADEPGKAVSVGATAVEVAAVNKDRAEITVQNDHATQIIYLRLEGGTTAQANQGIRLNAAGGSWASNAYKGAVSAIATGATTPALVTEV